MPPYRERRDATARLAGRSPRHDLALRALPSPAGHDAMSAPRRRPTKTERAQTRALVQVLAPAAPRVPLWALMQHKVGTCDPATCPLCQVEAGAP